MLTSDEHRLVEHACKTWADGHAKASLAVFAMLASSTRPQWAGALQGGMSEMSGGSMQPGLLVHSLTSMTSLLRPTPRI